MAKPPPTTAEVTHALQVAGAYMGAARRGRPMSEEVREAYSVLGRRQAADCNIQDWRSKGGKVAAKAGNIAKRALATKAHSSGAKLGALLAVRLPASARLVIRHLRHPATGRTWCQVHLDAGDGFRYRLSRGQPQRRKRRPLGPWTAVTGDQSHRLPRYVVNFLSLLGRPAASAPHQGTG